MSDLDEAVKRLGDWSAKNHLTMLGAVTGDVRTVLDMLAIHQQGVVDLTRLSGRFQRERDEALAVIERAKGRAHECYRSDMTCVSLDALSTAPVDALRERDAEKWDEGYLALRKWHPGGTEDPSGNPYRKEQS